MSECEITAASLVESYAEAIERGIDTDEPGFRAVVLHSRARLAGAAAEASLREGNVARAAELFDAASDHNDAARDALGPLLEVEQ